jgi:arginyl-tRNA synthetase
MKQSLNLERDVERMIKPYEVVNTMVDLFKTQVANLDITFTEFTKESEVGNVGSQLRDIVETLDILFSSLKQYRDDYEMRTLERYFNEEELKECVKNITK